MMLKNRIGLVVGMANEPFIAAGPIETRAASGIEDFDGRMQGARDHAASKRLVTIDAVGAVAAHLAPDRSSGITVLISHIDGGRHVRY